MLNTAYEMRISDLSSDVCSSDLKGLGPKEGRQQVHIQGGTPVFARQGIRRFQYLDSRIIDQRCKRAPIQSLADARKGLLRVSLIGYGPADRKSTSELQSLMRISYAVFCLNKKKK